MTALATRFAINGDAKCFAGEALTVELAFDTAGSLVDLTGRTFVWTIYHANTRAELFTCTGEVVVNGTDRFVRFAIDGDTTEQLFAKSRSYTRHEMAELVETGRDIWVEGNFALTRSASTTMPGVVVPASAGGSTRYVFDYQTRRVTISPRGAPGFSAAQQLTQAGVIDVATVEAMAEWQRKPAVDAAVKADADVAALAGGLGEFTSQRSAEIDVAIDKAEEEVAAFKTAARVDIDAAADAAANARARIDTLLSSRSRLQWWAYTRRGTRQLAAMSNPPAMSLPASAVSTITGQANGANATVPAQSPKLTYAGVLTTVPVTVASQPSIRFDGMSKLDGTRQRFQRGARLRFLTDAPVFEVSFVEQNQTQINALVDGEWAYRGVSAAGSLTSGGSQAVRHWKFDFGADQTSYGSANPQIAAGGSGYVSGDLLTAVGGTLAAINGRPATFRVIGQASGVITGVQAQDPGNYAAVPANPIATTGGTGSGATITGVYRTPSHTTRRLREVELLINSTADDFAIIGLQATAGDVFAPFPVNPRVPRLAWVGDSQTAGTWLPYAGQTPLQAAARLSMLDNLYISAMPGSGWVTDAGGSPRFSHQNRLADIISYVPDVIVFEGSQNDLASSTVADVQAAVIASLNRLLVALPEVRIVLIGPVHQGSAAYSSALANAAAGCVAPARVRAIDNFAEGWANPAQTAYLVSDNAHWGQYGNDEFRGRMLAARVEAKLLEMIA
jgi:hypothetical protein